MRKLEDPPGIKISSWNINRLRSADDTEADTALIAASEADTALLSVFEADTALTAASEAGADLQNLLNIINEKSESLGLVLNIKKAVTMIIFKKVDAPTCSIIWTTNLWNKWELQIFENIDLLWWEISARNQIQNCMDKQNKAIMDNDQQEKIPGLLHWAHHDFWKWGMDH